MEDIVERLIALNHADACDAADEIEQLRILGDALAKGIRTGYYDDALDAWEEARRG